MNVARNEIRVVEWLQLPAAVFLITKCTFDDVFVYQAVTNAWQHNIPPF